MTTAESRSLLSARPSTVEYYGAPSLPTTLVNCGGGPQGLGAAPGSVSKDLPMELNQDAAVAKTTIILS